MNVKDIAIQSSVVFSMQHDWFWGYVFQGSAKKLVRRGGITNSHSIVHSLSKILAKNYQNRLLSVEVTVSYISVIFRHSLEDQHTVTVQLQ